MPSSESGAAQEFREVKPMRSPIRRLFFLCEAVLLIALTACSGGGNATSSLPNVPVAKSPIQHIVVIIQENRSFDNLFSGFPGADSATSGPAHDGRTVALHSVTLEDGNDLGHSRRDFLYSYNNGAVNGFDLNVSFPKAIADYAYSYVNKAETAPYWAMAASYGLADNMFQSNDGASFVAHQYLIAGQSNMTIDLPLAGSPPHVVIPWGCDSPAGAYMLQFNAQGGVGFISVTANVAPHACADMLYELWRVLIPGGLLWARVATSIGIERHRRATTGRVRLPDGHGHERGRDSVDVDLHGHEGNGRAERPVGLARGRAVVHGRLGAAERLRRHRRGLRRRPRGDRRRARPGESRNRSRCVGPHPRPRGTRSRRPRPSARGCAAGGGRCRAHRAAPAPRGSCPLRSTWFRNSFEK